MKLHSGKYTKVLAINIFCGRNILQASRLYPIALFFRKKREEKYERVNRIMENAYKQRKSEKKTNPYIYGRREIPHVWG
jgi:hypothetical protein